MPQNEVSPGAATPEEVLHVVTQLMHTGEKPSDQLKAADMLAKHHGLLTPKEESGYDPEAIREIAAAVAEIAAEYDEPEPDPQSSDPAADDAARKGGASVRP
jgi:hypothetical protein